MAKAHTDLATLMRTQEVQVNEFLNKREGARKSVSLRRDPSGEGELMLLSSSQQQQINIEKKWKELNNCRHHVLKVSRSLHFRLYRADHSPLVQAKDKYEQDAISINSLHASASLLQGRDLDKVSSFARSLVRRRRGADVEGPTGYDEARQGSANGHRQREGL